VQVYFDQMIHQVWIDATGTTAGFLGIRWAHSQLTRIIENYFNEVDRAMRAHGVRFIQ
jgi:hypothetical protein